MGVVDISDVKMVNVGDSVDVSTEDALRSITTIVVSSIVPCSAHSSLSSSFSSSFSSISILPRYIYNIRNEHSE